MAATKQQIAHRFGVTFIVLALVASFLLIFVLDGEDAANEEKTAQQTSKQVDSVALLSARLAPLVAKAAKPAPTPKAKTNARPKKQAKRVVAADATPVRIVITAPKRTKPSTKKPRVTQVPISQWATTGDMQGKIDRCIGPVAVTIPGVPLLIAEHDYCGGAGRIAARHMGDRVQVTGAGSVHGTYKVVAIRRVPKGSSTNTLRGLGAAVLQTCVGNTLVLVGINRV